MSHIIKGNSIDVARPINSDFKQNPGPDVPVTPNAPAYAEPKAIPTAAISSSAWIVFTLKFLCFESSCKMSEAGVIG